MLAVVNITSSLSERLFSDVRRLLKDDKRGLLSDRSLELVLMKSFFRNDNRTLADFDESKLYQYVDTNSPSGLQKALSLRQLSTFLLSK